MENTNKIHSDETTDNQYSKDEITAANLFSRLKPDIQDAIIEVLRKMLDKQ